jgi:isopenicillin N synthase-like dioxygenase
MEPSFLAEVMKLAREFYKLPVEEKQKYSNLVNGKEFSMEGYGNDMVVSEKQILDWCDRLQLIVEPLFQRVYSMWPTQPPSFRYIVGGSIFMINSV